MELILKEKAILNYLNSFIIYEKNKNYKQILLNFKNY